MNAGRPAKPLDGIDTQTNDLLGADSHIKFPDGVQTIVPPGSILDTLPDICFIITPEEGILYVNSRVRELLQISPDECTGLTFSHLIEESYRNDFRSNLKRTFAEGMLSMEAKMITPSGTLAPFVLSLTPYQGAWSGAKNVCVIYARDISREKERDLDLLRFSNIAHGTVNPLEITDLNGRIIYVNPAFEKVSGYSREELIGNKPGIFGSGKHPKSFWDRMWQTISAGRVWVGEIENRKRNGEPFHTHLLVSPIIDGDGHIQGYFGVHRDISEQKRLERQLIHAQKMESIGMLAAGIAHEVGNPLTSISSLVQVIQRTTHDVFVNEKLDLIKSQISRISRIIRDLVDFSRPSNLEVQLTDVNKIVLDAVEIVRVGKKAKEIIFAVNVDQNIPPLSLVPDKLEQVFINILINAVDALQGTGVPDRADPAQKQQRRIAVATFMEHEQVCIDINDNGSGISENDLPKVFEPFFTTKKAGQGTGLGLWVTYTIIRSFQGNISVNSAVGKGTTFHITFPLQSELS